MSPPNTAKHTYNGIQVLRFIAASMVAIYHSFVFYDGLTKTPYKLESFIDPLILSRGVTIFFVISGFIMAMSSEGASVLKFLRHRVLRIYFGYIVAIVIAVCAKTAVFGSFPMQLINYKTISLLPLGVTEYPLGVEWSLIYEIVFYAVVIITILLRYTFIKISLMVAWAFAILYWGGDSTQFFPTASQVLLSRFNIGFIAGYLCWHLKWISVGRSRDLIVLGIALLLGDIIIIHPLYRELFAVAGASLIVLGVSDPQFSMRFSADHALVRWGNASYGLYLMHVTILGCVYAGSGQHSLGVYLTGLLMALAGGIFFGSCEFALYQRLKRAIDSQITKAIIIFSKPKEKSMAT